VYSEPHPLIDAEAAWLAAYEQSLDDSADGSLDAADDGDLDDDAVGA